MNQDKSESSSSEKPKRNPLERLIVWGGIALAIVIIFTEGTARFGYSMTLNRLSDRVMLDEGVDATPLTLDEVPGLIVGFPEVRDADQVYTLRFKGLVKEFGTIHLTYDEDKHVLGLVTGDAPEVEEKMVADGVDEEMEAAAKPEAEDSATPEKADKPQETLAEDKPAEEEQEPTESQE